MNFIIFRKWLVTCLVLLCSSSLIFASDHPTDAVELDGNVKQESALDDWQNINLGNSGAAVKTGVLADLPPKTIYWKGGSKDIQDITKWWYRDGSVPSKDDIRNAYAAAYYLDNQAGDEELVFYFGADRFANNGDAIFGFWFFQDKVGLGAGNRFDGEHRVHDLFVIMEYPQGSNSEPFVQVMEWNPAEADVSDNLKLLFNSENAKCGVNADAMACAITNTNEEQDNFWPYTSKSGPVGMYPPESLFEGRLNVTRALELAGITEIPCFSAFLVETRSSRSETAQLKDFVLGEFPLCSIAVTKTCGAAELNPDNSFIIDYQIMIENTGPGSFSASESVVIDDQPSNGNAFQLNGTVGGAAYSHGATSDGDGSELESGEILTVSGSYTSSVNGGSNIVDAKISLGSGYVIADQYSIGCDSLALSPLLDIVKNCSLSLEDVGGLISVRKDYDVTVCNTGSAPLDVILTDNIDSSLNESFSLDYAKSCDSEDDIDSCGAGNSCGKYTELLDPQGNSFIPQQYLFACKDADGLFIEAVEGGNALCEVRTGNYNPSTMPSGTNGMLSNTATAKATSPVVDTKLLRTVGESDGATCNLCPLTP